MKRILLTILILFSGNHFLNAQFTVESTTPIKNALNVNTSADITITFSDNVDPTTITATTVSISGSQGTPISFSTPTISGTNAVFNPSRDFFAGEVITITLAPGVLSTTGTGLTPFTTQFTTAVNPLSSGEFNFGQNTITTLLNGPKSVITADLDGDGDLDVLSASQNDDRIAWYENDGTANFSGQQTITTAADAATSVSVADLDGDGDLDVLSASQFDNRIAWYENAPNIVNLSVSTSTASEEDTTIITVTATANTAVPSNQTISVAVNGIGITASDFILSDTTIILS